MENIVDYTNRVSNIPMNKKISELKDIIKEMDVANFIEDKKRFEDAFEKALTLVIQLEADIEFIPEWYR